MSVLKNLIGENVINRSLKSVHTLSLFDASVENPVIGLYFSAHWCPPCREFTPVLADFYTRFRQTVHGQRLEIIFVSSDSDEHSYYEYLSEMPWMALPFHDRDHKVCLSS